jgi:prolyl-tRNA synthetase
VLAAGDQPADVHLVATGKDEEVFVAAETLARELTAAGLRGHLRRPRGVSPGVKFKDSELIGVPTIVVVGRGLATRGRRDQGPPLRRAPRGARLAEAVDTGMP